jgi:hypothetical protein
MLVKVVWCEIVVQDGRTGSEYASHDPKQISLHRVRMMALTYSACPINIQQHLPSPSTYYMRRTYVDMV